MMTQPELDEARAGILETLPDVCIIYAEADVPSDEVGSTERGWVVRAALVPCSFSALGGREAQIAARLGTAADAVVSLPAYTVVRGSDKILLTSSETGAEYEFEVVFVPKQTDELILRVIVQTLQWL